MTTKYDITIDTLLKKIEEVKKRIKERDTPDKQAKLASFEASVERLTLAKQTEV